MHMKPDQAISLAATRAAELGADVPPHVEEAGREAEQAAKAGFDQVAGWVSKNPWPAAGTALIVGTLIGLSLRGWK